MTCPDGCTCRTDTPAAHCGCTWTPPEVNPPDLDAAGAP